jgi:hypothetical protein
MAFVEDYYMIQAIPAGRSDYAFDVGVLPLRAGCGDDLIYAQAPDPSLNLLPVYRIPITQRIAWRGIEWKSFH